MATFKVKDPVTGKWIPQSVTSDGVQPDWNQDSPIESDYIKNKPFKTIGAGLTVTDNKELIADDGELIVEDNVLKRIGGGGGSQSDWEETNSTSSAFIKNKPFYSKIENVPDLPKKYWNNLTLEFENQLDTLAKEEGADFVNWFISAFKKNPQDCFVFSSFASDYEGFKLYISMVSGHQYTDEEIIEEFGSKENFTKIAASQLSSETGSPWIALDENSNIGLQNFPDLSKYIDPVTNASIQNITQNFNPSYEKINIGVDSVDSNVWGNTKLLFFDGFFLIQEINPGTLVPYLKGQNKGDFLIAITKLNSHVGSFEAFGDKIYEIEIIITDPSLFITREEPGEQIINGFEEIECPTPGYKRYQSVGKKFNYQDPYIAFMPGIGAIDTQVSYEIGVYAKSVGDSLVAGEVDTFRDIESIFASWSDKQWEIYIDSGMISSNVFQLYTKSNTKYFNAGDQKIIAYQFILTTESEDSYAYIDVPEDWEIYEDIKKFCSTTLNYELISAQYDNVKQIENKYIPKPEWWFGEKEYIVKEPEHILINTAKFMYRGDY